MTQLLEQTDIGIESGEWPRRLAMFSVHIDAVTMPEALAVIGEWIANPADRCRFIVTPNVDHIVLLQEHAGLRAAYANASLVLADGWPVVAASRWLGKPLPARVAGSDLVPSLFAAATPAAPLRVFLLGAAPGVADRAAANIHSRWPSVDVVGTYSPPLGFEKSAEESALILELVAATQPDLLVVGFGAPKQELWVNDHFEQLRATVAICAGATIDFLAGEKQRAPRWMQRTGLEWFHRLVTDPRRLMKRYLKDARVFPQLVWREWQAQR